MKINVLKIFKRLWTEKKRYKVLYGGRGSGKSIAVADYLLIQCLINPIRILCARQLQVSMRESVHKLLSIRIEELGLSEYFEVLRDTIRSVNGSEFIFKGLHHNATEIKSMANINKCWVEEAEIVTYESWELLIPTIRQEQSEIIITFNPSNQKAPTYIKFVEKATSDMLVIKANYYDNKYFPNVLRLEMESCRDTDYDLYLHIWLGEPRVFGNAVIFANGYQVKEFEPPKVVSFLCGLDFGFSVDPTAIVRCYVVDNELYIDYADYGFGLSNREIAEFVYSIPNAKNSSLYADCARPEIIDDLRKNYQINVKPCKKYGGSVIDGIQHIKSYSKIWVHPRCGRLINELETYSYKTDKYGTIMAIPSDSNNHCIDALRYALNDRIQHKTIDWDLLA